MVVFPLHCWGRKENGEIQGRPPGPRRVDSLQEHAAWLHCNSNPPTCGSQWGLCSKLVKECMSQGSGSSVQFHCSVDWANFQKAPHIYFFWLEKQEQKNPFFPAPEELTVKHCVSFVPCGQMCTDMFDYLFRAWRFDCFIFCALRNQKLSFSHPKMKQLCENLVLAVSRKVLPLKMEPEFLLPFTDHSVYAHWQLAMQDLTGHRILAKHCMGSENYLNLYRMEVSQKPADTSCLRCHLSLWSQFLWHFGISLECIRERISDLLGRHPQKCH